MDEDRGTQGGPPAPRTDTRSRILAISAALFHERGYAGTSMRDISDRLGTTKAALYYHFPRKEDILEALVAPALGAIDRIIADAEARPHVDHAELLSALVRSTAEAGAGLGALDIPAVVRDQDERFSIAARMDRIAVLLADGDDGAARVRAHAALGAMSTGMTAAARAYAGIQEPEVLARRFEQDLATVVAAAIAALHSSPTTAGVTPER